MAKQPRTRTKKSRTHKKYLPSEIDLGLVDAFKAATNEVDTMCTALRHSYGVGLQMLSRYPIDAVAVKEKDEDSYQSLKNLMTTYSRDMDSIHELITSTDNTFNGLKSLVTDKLTEDTAVDNYAKLLACGARYHATIDKLNNVTSNMLTNYTSIVEKATCPTKLN